MIDPKELRIGNHAILSNGEQKQVSGHDIYLAEIFPEHDFDPIPLTPEWLERLGFEKDLILGSNDKYWYKKGPLSYNPLHERWWFHGPLYGIEYVHQLQNLFFALTGEEL